MYARNMPHTRTLVLELSVFLLLPPLLVPERVQRPLAARDPSLRFVQLCAEDQQLLLLLLQLPTQRTVEQEHQSVLTRAVLNNPGTRIFLRSKNLSQI